MNNIIVKPIISEKMNRISEAAAAPKLNRIQRDKNKPAPKVLNRYGFVVDKRANKIEIKNAVESFYGVKVIAVNTMNYSGKVKARYTKAGYLVGRTNAFKKAIVTLAEGDSIDFYASI